MMRELWIARALLKQMQHEACVKYPLETGGVLVGYETSAGLGVVTQWLGPGPKAIHRKRSYVPDHDFHDVETARLYRESGRISVYLGDWHTHPDGPVALSLTDLWTLRRIARHAKARRTNPIMLIIGGASFEAVQVWQWRRQVFWGATEPLELRLYD